MRKIDFEQGSPEWLQWRKGLLTATDAAMLLGISPYVTPYKGWQRKCGLIHEQPVNSAMLRGQRDEPIARQMFIDQHGINMTPCCVESDRYNFIGASLDGISDCGKYLLEIKSQRPVDIVPDFHMTQIQHQILSTDMQVEKAFYVTIWENNIYTIEVLPDLDWMKQYVVAARDFWAKVIFNEPPELTSKDYKDMSSEAAWCHYATEYKNLCMQAKTIEELKDNYKKELIKICQEESAMGAGIKVLKKTTKGRIDYAEAFEVLNIRDDMIEPFRKPTTTSWMITLDR